MRLAPENIELRKSTERGGFTIWIGGEQWGVAAPQWCGGRGLMHNLRYPGGGAIQDKQENGYRYAAKVRGFKMRTVYRTDAATGQNSKATGPVPKQEDAIKIYMAALINRGLVESPADRKTRLAAAQAEHRTAQETRERHEDWTREGLISLAKIPGISDKEAFALKHAYREIFHKDMP